MTDYIIKYRWLIIVFFLALGISLGALIPTSETDPEIRNYIPQSMDSRIKTDKIEEEFGVQDLVMILFTDSTILTEDNLKNIKAADRAISRLTGVTNRTSPFTVRTIKSTEGMMTADPLIRRIPSDEAGFEKLREEILNNRFARDIVISSDMTTASISATINDAENESVTLQKIDSIAAAHSGSAEILKGGLPYIRHHIMKDVKKDAVFLVPLALLVMLLILKLSLGDWRSVLMPFSVVILSIAMCMGLIPLLGWKLSIITLLVPIILVGVANNYGIYLVARCQEIKQKHGSISVRSLVRELTGSLNKPIIFSGLTTVAGVLALLAHSIIPARQVGILAATGVALALIMSLILIPVLIWFRGNGKSDFTAKNINTRGFDRFLGSLSGIVIKRPTAVIVGFVMLTLILASGITLLRIETNQEKFFPKNNPLRMASDIINKKFGGSQTISVMVEGNIKEPEVMQGIDNLTARVEKVEGVGQVFSISQAVREMSKALFLPDEEGYDKIPQTRAAIAQMFELYNMSGNPDDFRQMMNLENTRAHILIRLSQPENRVIRNVKSVINEATTGFPAEITVGGYAIIMTDFAASIIRGQVTSLLFALITVFVFLTLIFKSFRGGIVGSVPLATSILILFGFMGFSGIALDAATALLSSIMIGVGVDFTIQYIWNFNIQLRKGLTYEESTQAAMKTIGRSIIINACGVMAGFSVLILSGFTSIRFFGYLVLISIGSCLAGALVLIPAILMRFRPGFAEQDMNKSKTRKNEKSNNLINVNTAAFANIGTIAGCRADT